MVAAYLTILVIVGLIVGLIVPELIRAVQLLLNETPALIDRLYGELMKYPEIAQYLPNAEANLGELGADWQQLLTRVLEWLGGGWNGLMNSVVATVSGVFSGAVTLVMGFMFSFYILYGKEKLGRQVRRLMRTYLKPAWCERTFYVLNVLDDSFHRYVVGQCTEAVILGTLCMLGMLIFGFPYATMIGALVGATALIPIAGAYIGAGVGAILILTVSPMEALLFLVFIVVLQQLEGNIVYPRVVGSQLGLPALWVLAAITVGGNVMGIGGMLLAVPLTTAIYRLVRENVRKRELARARRRTRRKRLKPRRKSRSRREKRSDGERQSRLHAITHVEVALFLCLLQGDVRQGADVGDLVADAVFRRGDLALGVVPAGVDAGAVGGADVAGEAVAHHQGAGLVHAAQRFQRRVEHARVGLLHAQFAGDDEGGQVLRRGEGSMRPCCTLGMPLVTTATGRCAATACTASSAPGRSRLWWERASV